jgi:8-oxo-dGTP pyrophosphatase MutT (NUDIX family)
MLGTMHEQLTWHEETRKTLFNCRVFSVSERTSRSPAGKRGTFFTLEAADWAIVIPVLETERGTAFAMVRQWRHSALELSLEFPGGVIEPGEDSEKAALRELHEETGYRPERIRELAVMSPNPAIMANRVHFFLAEGLSKAEAQELDDDEYVDLEIVPAAEVIASMGTPPYIHALMASALGLYLRDTITNTQTEKQHAQ